MAAPKVRGQRRKNLERLRPHSGAETRAATVRVLDARTVKAPNRIPPREDQSQNAGCSGEYQCFGELRPAFFGNPLVVKRLPNARRFSTMRR